MYERSYWEEKLKDANEKWILGHLVWTDFWAEDDAATETHYHGHRGVIELGDIDLIEDPQGRGFVLVHYPIEEYDKDIAEIYFAFVIPEHRRRGVLRGMMERLKNTARRKKIWIECKKDLGPMWRAQGFEPCKKRRPGGAELYKDCEEEYVMKL